MSVPRRRMYWENLEDGHHHLITNANRTDKSEAITELKDMSIKATRTVWGNQIEKCPLESEDVMKKKEAGAFDFRVDAKNEVFVCRWNDNNVVNMCSNAVGIEPISMAAHYSAKEKKKIQIKQPYRVKVYDEHMGGVDRMDHNVSKYRIAIRGKMAFLHHNILY